MRKERDQSTKNVSGIVKNSLGFLQYTNLICSGWRKSTFVWGGYFWLSEKEQSCDVESKEKESVSSFVMLFRWLEPLRRIWRNGRLTLSFHNDLSPVRETLEITGKWESQSLRRIEAIVWRKRNTTIGDVTHKWDKTVKEEEGDNWVRPLHGRNEIGAEKSYCGNIINIREKLFLQLVSRSLKSRDYSQNECVSQSLDELASLILIILSSISYQQLMKTGSA